MKTISTTELRSKTRSLVRSLENGVTIGLTYRGQKVAEINPVRHGGEIKNEDPLYRFHHNATPKAKPLSDREMDRLIYGG